MATSPATNGPRIQSPRILSPVEKLEERVAFFAARQLHVNPRRVTNDSRLREDLGLSDDDAIEFFEAYSAEFHVDIDSLFSRYWARHFGPFGIGWGTLFLMFLTASSAGFLAGISAPREAWLLWASLSLLELVVMQGYPFLSPELNLVPIRVSDLVKAARQGFWYEPSNGRRRRSASHRHRDPAFGPILVPPVGRT
ncbi:MAG TPA: DUF1493 family protein [Bryobacteraceae bacterium]|nr:DUF1493 family protein [Bryobacteraceae bacterium]